MLQKFRNAILRKDRLRYKDIMSIAQLALPEEWYGKEFTYFHQDETDRGTRPISEELGLLCYLSAYGKMHRDKIRIALSNMNLAEMCTSNINIVDWGCGQGLATFVFLDYLAEQGIECEVDSITLIEPSALAIENAELFLTQRQKDENTQIRTINKLFGDLSERDFEGIGSGATFHLYSNILDVPGINMKELSSWLNVFPTKDNYIISASPKYWSGDERIRTFFSYLNNARILWSREESNKAYNEWGVNFTFNIKIAHIHSVLERVKRLAFYAPRQFFAAYIMDSLAEYGRFARDYAAFDVYAPYEIGTSYKDDVDPVYAVLSNMISRGLPTKASPYVEEVFSKIYAHSLREEKYGTISYPSTGKISASICDDIRNDRLTEDSLLLLSPIAISRIQKVVVEALITGRLSIEQDTWEVLVDEGDIPSAAIAFKELEMMFNNLTSLSENYSERKLPSVKLDVVNNRFYDSKLHLDANVYHLSTEVCEKSYDLVIENSFACRDAENSFDKYKTRTDCYYALYTATEETAQRYIYTTDLIEYKSLCSVDDTGKFIEVDNNKVYLEYFLSHIFRKVSFRMGQIPILNRALKNKSVIGLLPTGGGKSLTYQLAAMLQPGVTLIIDPLQSLMLDQYEGLLANGIDCCTYINSSISGDEKTKREYMVERSQCLFAFMAPERLCMYSFRKRLKNMHDMNVYFSYAVIDEVHCVSEWGQDFRFSYLHLGRNLYNYVKSKVGVVTLFGLTATASFDVLADVERELSGHGSYRLDSEALVRCEDTNRLELQYRIIPVPIEFNEIMATAGYDKSHRIAEHLPRPVMIGSKNRDQGKSSHLCEVVERIPAMVRELTTSRSVSRIVDNFFERQSSEPVEGAGDKLYVDFPDDFANDNTEYPQAGIIFCPHRANTDMSVEVCASKLGEGISDIGRFYSLDDDYDNEAADAFDPMQEMTDFRDNKLPLMVATKAFGMGIDKPNVRFTVNVNYSNSLEAYVQEAGRAGRDKSMALSVILVSDFNLARVSRKCQVDQYPLRILKGYWFKEEDLKEILDYYHISLSSDAFEFCNPNVDVVQLVCHYNEKALYTRDSRAEHCSKCDRKANCQLGKLKDEHPGYCTLEELEESAAKLGIRLVGRNIKYQSPDYAAMMYFWATGFPGLFDEKKVMNDLLSKFYVSSFIGDTVEVNNETLQTHKGLLDFVLDQEVGSEVVSIIKYTSAEDPTLSKAIYRMCCIGFIDDFTKDYNKKEYRVVCIRKTDEQYYECLREFLMRYYPEDKASKELEKAKLMKGENAVHRCLAYLTEFIYEKLAVKKKRAIDDIRAFCNLGLTKDKDWKEVNEDLKDYIYYYFNSKYAKEDYKAENGEPYSLTVDTDYGKLAPLDIVHKYIKVVEDSICGASGNPNDNIKHLQGAVRLILRSLTRDNPVIDLLNVYCILMLGEYKRNPSIKGMLEHSYENAYNALWEEFDIKNEFYSYISKVKDDMFNHGADKSYAVEMDLIEMNAEINRYKLMIDNLNWKIK